MFKYRSVIAATLIGILLIFLLHTLGKRGYVFLYWNLFLAALPILFGYLASISKLKYWYLWCIPWLLLLPNSFYMWTDIIHPLGIVQYACSSSDIFFSCDTALIKQLQTPQLDGSVKQLLKIGAVLYVITLAAWYGLISWKLVATRIPPRKRHKIFLLLTPILACGIVLGRFSRTNSWYVLTDPIRVVQDMLTTVHNILTNPIHATTFVISCMWILTAYTTNYLTEPQSRSTLAL